MRKISFNTGVISPERLPALVAVANTVNSRMTVYNNDSGVADAHSLLELLLLWASCSDHELQVSIEGEDEQLALEKLSELLESG